MHLIHAPVVNAPAGLPVVRIPVERLVLAKRRWRGVAEDGVEFGFALEHPLRDGEAVFATETALYVVAQKYEPVLELRIADCGLRIASDAARLGWIIGNLHFPLQIDGEVVRVEDDVALQQLFEREGIPYVACKRVFHPLSGGHRH
jgi:urease accessory protein